jgi:hypothetical protein
MCAHATAAHTHPSQNRAAQRTQLRHLRGAQQLGLHCGGERERRDKQQNRNGTFGHFPPSARPRSLCIDATRVQGCGVSGAARRMAR